MKLRLVQTPGIVGKKKVAEEDLAQHSPSLQEHLTDLFSKPAPVPGKLPLMPDKENLYLELEGKRLPVQSLPANEELKKLIDQMKASLQWQK